MTDNADLRDQAAKCRYLAADALAPLTVERLLALAADYDARATLPEERTPER